MVDGMLLDWGVSIRRACRVLPFDTSSYHYQSRRTDPAFLRKRIKEICETYVRRDDRASSGTGQLVDQIRRRNDHRGRRPIIVLYRSCPWP